MSQTCVLICPNGTTLVQKNLNSRRCYESIKSFSPSAKILFSYMGWCIYGENDVAAPRNDTASKALEKLIKYQIELRGSVAFIFRSSTSKSLLLVCE